MNQEPRHDKGVRGENGPARNGTGPHGQHDSREAWAARAGDLASWAWAWLAHRRDTYGGYRPLAERGKEFTRRDGSRGTLGKSRRVEKRLWLHHLERHFRGERVEDIVGLYSTSRHNTCAWGVFDIDAHDVAEPQAALCRAAALYVAAERRGFRPLWFDSGGGWHIWLILSWPVPSRDVYHLMRSLASEAGVGDAVEWFPKQAALSEATPFGNWVRLPGRHHTRD